MASEKEGLLLELLEWARASNFDINPSLELVYDAKIGQNKVMATNGEINENEILITCPESYVIGPRLARELFGLSHMVNIQPFIKMALLHEAGLRSKSRWWPYIRILPSVKELTHPYFFDEQALRLIEGTNIALTLKDKIKQWEQEFESAIDYLTETDSPEELSEMYTFDDYLWASLIFTSRSFPARLLYPEELDDRLSVLVPMVDMLNHKPQLPINWTIDSREFKLVSGSKIGSGEEVFNNYGAKGNEELLLGYGFSIENNPFDNVPLKLRLSPQVEDSESSLFYLGRNGIPNDLIASFVKLIAIENDYPRTDSVLAQAHSLAALSQALRTRINKITDITAPFDTEKIEQVFACWYTEGIREVYRDSIADCAERLDNLITTAISDNTAYVLNLDTMVSYYYKDSKQLLDALLEFYGLSSVDDLISNDLEDEAIQLYLAHLYHEDKVPLPDSNCVEPQQYDAFESQFKQLIPAFEGPKWTSSNLARLAEYWTNSFQSLDRAGRQRQTLVIEKN